jgi:non-homologous end joining protein Ku
VNEATERVVRKVLDAAVYALHRSDDGTAYAVTTDDYVELTGDELDLLAEYLAVEPRSTSSG